MIIIMAAVRYASTLTKQRGITKFHDVDNTFHRVTKRPSKPIVKRFSPLSLSNSAKGTVSLLLNLGIAFPLSAACRVFFLFD